MAVVSPAWLRIGVVSQGQPWQSQGDWNEPMLAMMRLDDYNGYGELSLEKMRPGWLQWVTVMKSCWTLWAHGAVVSPGGLWWTKVGCDEHRLQRWVLGGSGNPPSPWIIDDGQPSSGVICGDHLGRQQHISPGECGDQNIQIICGSLLLGIFGGSL